jgi:hypothetical protein
MSRSDTVYTCKGTFLGPETAKAVQFRVDSISGCPLDTSSPEWFPFSQVTKMMRSNTDGEDEIIVSEWILDQKGLI